MSEFEKFLSEQLDSLKRQSLYRQLRRIDSPQGRFVSVNGKELLNFASNDYLGLANEPAIKSAAIEAIAKYGAGSGSSRLLCGSLAPLHHLEESLADFKKTEAALTFSTGYGTAMGTIPTLVGRDDTVIIDRLSHACIVDAARASGANLRVFAHNDLADLEDILKDMSRKPGPTQSSRKSRILIITESVFSMDGDVAPLAELVELKNKHGAWLMLDEAHATGLYGTEGRGLAEYFGVASRVEIQMGTLGKALASAGGFICGSRHLIDHLVNRARTLIFSTAPVPAAAAAASAALTFCRSEPGESRRKHLQNLSRMWCAPGTQNTDRPPATSETPPLFQDSSPAIDRAIFPIMIGNESRALAVASALASAQLLVPAIRYPTVKRGTARLRVSLSANLLTQDIGKLILGLNQASWITMRGSLAT